MTASFEGWTMGVYKKFGSRNVCSAQWHGVLWLTLWDKYRRLRLSVAFETAQPLNINRCAGPEFQKLESWGASQHVDGVWASTKCIHGRAPWEEVPTKLIFMGTSGKITTEAWNQTAEYFSETIARPFQFINQREILVEIDGCLPSASMCKGSADLWKHLFQCQFQYAERQGVAPDVDAFYQSSNQVSFVDEVWGGAKTKYLFQEDLTCNAHLGQC